MTGEDQRSAAQSSAARPSAAQPSDEQLMADYVAGQSAAFDALFRRHAPVLLRVLERQLRRQADAQDLLQQTFLQLHRNRRDYDVSRPLRPWLFTIALNLKREYFRRLQRKPESELDLVLGHPATAVGPRGQERTEARDAILYALARLSDDQREVIALHWFGGVPLPEVAEMVGASVSAVKVRAHRGYAAMRKALDESG